MTNVMHRFSSMCLFLFTTLNGVNAEKFLNKTNKVAYLLAKDRRPTGYSDINGCLAVIILNHSNE